MRARRGDLIPPRGCVTALVPHPHTWMGSEGRCLLGARGTPLTAGAEPGHPGPILAPGALCGRGKSLPCFVPQFPPAGTQGRLPAAGRFAFLAEREICVLQSPGPCPVGFFPNPQHQTLLLHLKPGWFPDLSLSDVAGGLFFIPSSLHFQAATAPAAASPCSCSSQ